LDKEHNIKIILLIYNIIRKRWKILQITKSAIFGKNFFGDDNLECSWRTKLIKTEEIMSKELTLRKSQKYRVIHTRVQEREPNMHATQITFHRHHSSCNANVIWGAY
jgi:hypothetical protein